MLGRASVSFLGPGGGPDDTTPDVAVMGVDYVRFYERIEPLTGAEAE